MKLLPILGGLLLSAFFLPSCKEVGPEINLHGDSAISDTTYLETPVATPEQKNALLEEFTGVRCPNCPQGHEIVRDIKTQFPGRVVSVSLHPINQLGHPYAFSTQNFESDKAQTLFDYMVQVGFEPVAAVDRKLFQGQTNILVDKARWLPQAGAQLNLTTPVNLNLSSTYDTSTREVTVVAELHYTATDTTPNRLTIMLTESDIISAQLDGAHIDTFYTHNDVMRDIITATQGDGIDAKREPGRVVRKVYKKLLDNAWKAENMHIVGFVHEFTNEKIVYQVKEIKLQ